MLFIYKAHKLKSSSVTVRLRSHAVMKWIENLQICSFFVSVYLLTQAECGESSIALKALSVLFLIREGIIV